MGHIGHMGHIYRGDIGMTYNATTMLAGLFQPVDLSLPQDWRFAYEERAAIMEYCGNLPRTEAERRALFEVANCMKESEERTN